MPRAASALAEAVTGLADSGLEVLVCEPLRRLRAHGEATRAELLARARQQLDAGAAAEAVLEQLAHALTNRLLHAPTAALREAAVAGDADMLRALQRLLPAGNGDDDAADPAP